MNDHGDQARANAVADEQRGTAAGTGIELRTLAAALPRAVVMADASTAEGDRAAAIRGLVRASRPVARKTPPVVYLYDATDRDGPVLRVTSLHEDLFLEDVLFTAVGRRLLRKFVALWSRRHLAAIVLRPPFDEGDAQQVIDILLGATANAPRGDGQGAWEAPLETDGGPAAPPVDAIGHDAVIVPSEAALPWRSRLVATAALRADEALRRAGAVQVAERAAQVLRDTGLAEAPARELAEALSVLGTAARQEAALAVALLQAVSNDALVALSAWLRHAIGRAQARGGRVGWVEARGGHVAVALLGAAARLMFARRLPQADALLVELSAAGMLPPDQLPRALRSTADVHRWTRSYLRDPQGALARVHGARTAAQLDAALRPMEQALGEMVRRGLWDPVRSTLEGLAAIARSDAEPFAGRNLRVREAWQRGARAVLGHAPVALARRRAASQALPVVRTLAAVGVRAVPLLLDQLRLEGNREVRAALCAALCEIGPPASDALVRQLRRPEHPWYFHRNLVMVAGRMRLSEAFDDVRAFLQHPHLRVREEAAAALARIAPERAVEPLLEALLAEDIELQPVVLSLLARLRCRDPRFIEWLFRCVERIGEGTAPSDVAVAALGAVEHVARGTPLSREFVEALARIAAPSAWERLRAALGGGNARPPVVEQALARTLAGLAGPRDIAALRRVSRTGRGPARDTAREALRRIGAAA